MGLPWESNGKWMQTKPICFSFPPQPFQQPIVKQNPYLFTHKNFSFNTCWFDFKSRNPFLLDPTNAIGVFLWLACFHKKSNLGWNLSFFSMTLQTLHLTCVTFHNRFYPRQFCYPCILEMMTTFIHLFFFFCYQWSTLVFVLYQQRQH